MMKLPVLPSPPCPGCNGACCRKNPFDDDNTYAVLLQPEDPPIPGEVVHFDQWGTRRIEERVIPYVRGKCIHLGRDNGCNIYETRPIACRQFNCIAGYGLKSDEKNVWHGFFLEDRPKVVKLIERVVPKALLDKLVQFRRKKNKTPA